METITVATDHVDKEKVVQELKEKLAFEIYGSGIAYKKSLNGLRFFKIAAIVLTAGTTIVGALKGNEWSTFITLILGTAATALTSLQLYYNYGKQRKHLSKTYHDYLMLDKELDFYYKTIPIEKMDSVILGAFVQKFLDIGYVHANSVVEFNDNEENKKIE